MDLATTYRRISPGIVAFAPRYKYAPAGAPTTPPGIPQIFGTGFVVDEGLVVTNDHVIRAAETLPRPIGSNDWPFVVTLLLEVPDEGIVEVPLHVLGVFEVGEVEVAGNYFGPRRPDLALVHVKGPGLAEADR